jgi:hypothetical protein
MVVITYEVATDIVFPNITVHRKFADGVHSGYEIYSNEGYVMYDTAANNTELDPDTMEEVPVTYYYTWLSRPANFNFTNFTWVAVPRDSVDENYIFGVIDRPEIM